MDHGFQNTESARTADLKDMLRGEEVDLSLLEDALSQWPFHVLQVMAEIFYPVLSKDTEMAVEAAKHNDFWLDHYYEINYPLKECRPYNNGRFDKQQLAQSVDFIFKLVEQGIGDVRGRRDPDMVYDLYAGYRPADFN